MHKQHKQGEGGWSCGSPPHTRARRWGNNYVQCRHGSESRVLLTPHLNNATTAAHVSPLEALDELRDSRQRSQGPGEGTGYKRGSPVGKHAGGWPCCKRSTCEGMAWMRTPFVGGN